jgi:hypothetical protein
VAMDLLAHISSSPLPKSFGSPDDIDKIRVLRAAGLVIALIPAEASPAATSPEQTAQVIAITQKGREELQRGSTPDGQLADEASTSELVRRLRGLVERARESLR